MNKTVLIIEDDKDLRETTCDLLVNEGFVVFQADNGAQGVQLAIQKSPDIIICDINLPNLTGYEVYSMLHQISTTSVIPFVFLSAKSTRDDILAGLHLGADDYITKPFEFSELLEAINRRIDSRKRIAEQHEEKFNALFTNIHIGACILVEGCFEYVNEPLSNLLGYRSEELLRLSLTNIVHRDSLDELSKTLEQCEEGAKTSFTLNLKVIRKNEEIVELIMKGSNIRMKGAPRILCTLAETKEFEAEIPPKNLSPLPNITPREMDVLKLICEGYSNVEIAGKLFVSDRTVEGHRSRLFSKTNTKNAVSLAMWAIRKNVVKMQ